MTPAATTEVEVGSSLDAVVQAAARTDDVAAWVRDVRSDGGRGHARANEFLLPLLVAAAHRGVAEGRAGATDEQREPMLLVVANDTDAERFSEAIGWYVGRQHVAPYVSRGVQYGGGVAPSASRVGSRQRARDIAAARGIVVASVDALFERVPQSAVRPTPVHIKVGGIIDRDALIERLIDIGYERVEQADERGQCAVRGDIVDVFDTTAQHPVRVEFFDDEIESIRRYSPFTQRSLGPLDQIAFQPASEIVGVGSAASFWASEKASGDEGNEVVDPIIELADGALDAGWKAFAKAHVVVWETAQVQKQVDELGDELAASHVPKGAYSPGHALTRILAAADHIDSLSIDQRHQFEAQLPVFGAIGFAEAEAELHGLATRELQVIVTFPHPGHLGRTQSQLKRVATRELARDPIDDERGIWLAVSQLATGFVSAQLGIAVVPSGRLFRTKVSGKKGSASERVGQAMQAFTSLSVGDYVVHEDHGIAQFSGFETKTVAGVTRDYLKLHYAGSDKVFVPHEQMGKVTRYIGADGGAPTLSKLGGKRWDTIRNRARQAVRELAGELLALYAKRSRAVGHPFPEDDEVMQRFELTFPFEETEDQLTSINAVKGDMEQPHPMDRLICGDVGFGKTEVAMRAAVKAVAGSKQVMVLVPTTVLADQHLRSFRERIGDLPITVDMVSRFRTPKKIKTVLAEFAAGKVDILIGTHRLLSRDVMPRDLGLVIVDEEQRFGVAQKELLRQMRLEVDVMSMSATPIPRTLHMSLAGLRDISVIETAPRGRRAINTHVGEYDEEIVRMAIEREIQRDGQIFYLHNRVETIDETAAKISQIVPKARVAVGHGQMTEKQLEGVMMGFMRRDFDVLVATTIIESGLDVPSANTLIVDRADALGMSQLYQIRGRVGRSTRSAHAYLFYPSARELSDEARARLTTLSDFSELGSGSKIAMRDLELRGAGNLLGAEQSGHVAAIGFELYVDMLAQSVAMMSGEPIEQQKPTLIDTKLHAYVPADYVASEAIKIDVHRRIALSSKEEKLDELIDELTDRFGEPPEPMTNLVDLGRMRILMERMGAERLMVGAPKVSLGPVTLSSNQMAYLKPDAPWAVYSSNNREIGVRVSETAEAAEKALHLLRSVVKVLGV